MKRYDAIIIGFGKGGKLLAAELANRNWKVAVIERSPEMYGGTCINVGCIPTKTMIHEAEFAERIYQDDYKKQSKLYSLALKRKDKLVTFLREKNVENLTGNPNITLYDGTASFVCEDTVKVTLTPGKDEESFELEGKEIFINTGSTPILPDIDGLRDNKYVYTSDTLLHADVLPQHLLIIGSGAIGLEFATMYAGFGSKVTILEAGKRFLPKADREIAEYMQESLKRKNIEIRLNARVQSLHDTADGITAAYTDASDGTPYFLEGDALLIATGRKPMIDDLHLEKARVQINAQGAIVVNEQLRTTVPHIWALGDVRGGEMYDYLSIDDSRIILNHLFGNKERSIDDRNPVPYAIFTDPPMAHIGLTEEDAVKRGYPIKISRLPASAIPRARTLQNMDGMLKAIVNTDTEKILGCSLFCIDAPELINLVAFAIKTGQKSSALRNFIFTHPSMSEGLNGLFKAF